MHGGKTVRVRWSGEETRMVDVLHEGCKMRLHGKVTEEGRKQW